MADQPAPAPAPDLQAAADAFAGGELMPEAGPMAGSTLGETSQGDEISAIFGLPPAGSQGGGEGDAGLSGAQPAAPAAGEGGGVQTPPNAGQPAGTSPPAAAPAEPGAQTPNVQPQPGAPPPELPPVATPGSAAPAQGQPPVAAPLPAGDPRDLELASLKAQIELLKQRPAAQPAPQPGATAPQGQPQPAPQAPVYGLQVPLEHLSMIQSDNPAQAQHAMSDLINQTAVAIHTRVLADVQPLVQNAIQSFSQSMAAEQTTNAAIEDYYTNFAAHRVPAIQAIVAQEAATMQAEFPGVPWSENYRNTLGARVNGKLQTLGVSAGAPAPAPVAQPATPAPAPAVVLPPQPATMLTPGSRPALAGATDPAQFMIDTFS